jgi:hypothetical protein
VRGRRQRQRHLLPRLLSRSRPGRGGPRGRLHTCQQGNQ